VGMVGAVEREVREAFKTHPSGHQSIFMCIH
jgi:hypothetical protein